MDEPVKYEKPMTMNEQEIEKVKAQIKMLQKKLEFYKELEKTKSPVEEAYKDWMGVYPLTNPSVDGVNDIRWRAFQMGYNAAQKDYKVGEYQEEQGTWNYDPDAKFRKQTQERGERVHGDVERVFDGYEVVEYQPTPQNEKQVEEGLRSAMRTAIKEGIIPEIKQPTDELIDKLVKNPPSFLRFELGSTLETRIYKWWETCFTTHCEWSMEECIDDLLDIIELFLPGEQNSEGTQRIETIIAVDTHNELLRKIKSKLRNKKDT